MTTGAAAHDERHRVARERLRSHLFVSSRHTDPVGVVSHLVAVQAQDHTSARWSVARRLRSVPTAAAVDSAFDDGRILRTHVLRPTWHYVAPSDLRWLMRLRGPGLDAANARRYGDLGLDARTLARSRASIARAVADASRTRHELAAALEAGAVPTDGQRLTFVLLHAELTAVICSGPMRATRHTYAAFDSRVPPQRGPTGEEALAQLARRYFSSRGPATLDDFSWWSGLSKRDARRGLDAARGDLATRSVDARPYFFDEGRVADGPRRGRARSPAVALVPCFDEIVIAYRESRDVLRGDDGSVPVPGYVAGFRHTVLVDGRMVGHWRPDPTAPNGVETRLLRRLGAEERRRLDEEVARYRSFAEVR